MKKIMTLALIGATTLATPAFAQTQQQDVQSDVNAIHKDDAAIAKDNSDIAKDRARKAMDKANGNYGKEAMDSTAIGADKTAKAEKESEKSADQKILQHQEQQ